MATLIKLPKELQSINNLYPPKQTYLVPTSYKTPEAIKAQEIERVSNNVSNGFSDAATNLITLGTQFRFPKQKEIENARAGWKGRFPLLAEGITYGLGYDMLGAGMNFLAPKIANELITGKVTKEALDIANGVVGTPTNFVKGVSAGIKTAKLIKPAEKVLNKEALGKFEELRRLQNLVATKGLEDPVVLKRIINSSMNDDVVLNLFGKNKKDLTNILNNVKDKTASTRTEPINAAEQLMNRLDFTRELNLPPETIEQIRNWSSTHWATDNARVPNQSLVSHFLDPLPEFVNINLDRISSPFRMGKGFKSWEIKGKVKDLGENIAGKLMLGGRKDIIPYRNIKNPEHHLGYLFDPKIAADEIKKAADTFNNAPKGYHIASSSLSDSSFPIYASKVAEIVNKTPNTRVFFNGYHLLNSAGRLSQNLQKKDIANYLNTKISNLNVQGKRIPGVIIKSDPAIPGSENLWYPDIVVQKYQFGKKIDWLNKNKNKKERKWQH